MSEEQKLDDLMEDLDEQDKKPYETEVVGTGQYGSDFSYPFEQEEPLCYYQSENSSLFPEG